MRHTTKLAMAARARGLCKAANFRHLGRAGDEWHAVDGRGRPSHRLRAYRYAKRNGISTAEARQRLGLRPQRTRGRDRWFLDP
jgi:hypothetical protein